MRYVYKKEFLKRLASYPAFIQGLVLETDQQIKEYIGGHNPPFGLRIKKIGPKTFEARATDKISIVWVKEGDSAYFALLGNHDEVRRFIRKL